MKNFPNDSGHLVLSFLLIVTFNMYGTDLEKPFPISLSYPSHQLASQDELTILLGLAEGKDGLPRGYVKVELSGPENKTIYTKKDGTFKAELTPGTYEVTITEKSRFQHHTGSFEVTIEKGIENSFTFPLNW